MSIDIRELERLHNKASRGPWKARGICGPKKNPESACPYVATSKFMIADTTSSDDLIPFETQRANTELIVLLRNSLPDILSALRDKEALEQRAKRAEMAMAVFWNRTGPHQGSTWMPTPLLQTWLDEADALLRDKERLDRLERQWMHKPYLTDTDDPAEEWSMGYAFRVKGKNYPSLRAAIDALPEEGK